MAAPDLANLQLHLLHATGITVTGSGVSTWADQSGNSRDGTQTTDASRPTYNATTGVTFDGVDDYLQFAAFTLNQPITYYIRFTQLSWTNIDGIFDGNTNNSGKFVQESTTPDLFLYAGQLGGPNNSDMTLNVEATATIVLNGASSTISIDGGTDATGNPGTNNPGGFILGANANLNTKSNIRVKDVLIYSVAHDGATQTSVRSFMNPTPPTARLLGPLAGLGGLVGPGGMVGIGGGLAGG